MIDICVTYFGDKYSTKYIDNLQNGIARNYSGDFNFLVETNCPNGHWDKIGFFECDNPRIIMDIDMLITGNLDELFDYEVPENTLAAFPRWWRRGGCPINGGFYKINPGPNIWSIVDKFYADPGFWINHYGRLVGTFGKGEQDFINDSTYWINELPGQWLGIHTEGSERYDKDIHNKYYYQYNLPMMKKDKFAEQVKLVHFIYDDNMIEQKPQWIQDLWNTT
jgi:hypothetical protein